MASAFQRLPVEINANIAGLLEDADVCRFALVCRDTSAAVNCDSSPTWRRLFIAAYDLPDGVANDKLKHVYQMRKRIMRTGARFKAGKTKQEQESLAILRDLIIESFLRHRGQHDDGTSLNMIALKRFCDNHNIMQDFLSPRHLQRVSPLLLAIQIMMMHFQLNEATITYTLSFPISQRAVYSTIQQEPLFRGKDGIEVNLPLVAHCFNFFKHHMTRPEETMYHMFKSLKNEKPKLWRKGLVDGAQTLGKKWAGVYGYLEPAELDQLRANDNDDVFLMDQFQEEGDEIQTIDLDFPSTPGIWPNLFENHLKSLSHPSSDYLVKRQTAPKRTSKSKTKHTRAQTRETPTKSSTITDPINAPINPKSISFQFTGAGYDQEGFLAIGWLNPLPPQQGIPGWQRMTMMKFYIERELLTEAGIEPYRNDMAAAIDDIDLTSLWAYEGVVLPGGEMMIGRWWKAQNGEDEEMYSGPFLMWCMD